MNEDIVKTKTFSLSSVSKGKIAVTGSDGYIGSWFCRSFQIPVNQQWSHRNGREWDVTIEGACRNLVRNTEVILHLAGISGVNICNQDPKRAFQVNGEATFALAQTAKKQGVRRFIFASTSAVYGDLVEGSIGEDAPVQPKNVYGQSKLAGEKVLELADEKFEVVVLRKSNVYGYGAVFKGRNAIDSFLTNYFDRASIEITGDGSQVRDYIHLMDIVALYGRIATCPRAQSGIYNVGGHESVSIKELAQRINAVGKVVFGYEVPVRLGQGNAGASWIASKFIADKVRKEFGFAPCFYLEDYIKERMLMELRKRS